MASRMKHFAHSIRNRTTHRPPPDSGPSMPSHTSAPAPVPSTSMKESAKLAWHAFKMVSKNIEKFLDGTPFKLPFGVLNTIIGIADSLINNRESMAILLLPIGQRLEIVSSGLDRNRYPGDINSTCERFSGVLTGAVAELKAMYNQGILKRLVNSNEHPQQLADIFRRIDEATKNFGLELTLAMVRQVRGIKESTDILRLRDLRPSREARYTEVQRDGCVDGTREEIIENIMAWCTDDSPDCPPIYWLSGMAGTGKSTIAYTICEKLYDDGDASRRLGASFFCSRQLEGARLRQNVIPTIAHDLAHSFPDFGRALLASKFDVQPPPLKSHIRSLLSGPWRSVAANSSLPPLVVVIDALDELEGGQGSHFLEQLIREMAQYPGGFQRLRFFVTSRQDPRIVKICDCIDSRAVCRLEEVPSDIIENDIHLYLCTALPSLDRSTLRTLAQHSSGLFIYAATAVRFIIPPSQEEKPTLRMQTERLDLLLRAWPDKSECGVDGLLVDHLYEEVLSLWLSPKSEVQQRIARAVLQTVICTEEPILITDIPRFLESEFDVEEEEALNLILSLHAVLYVFENRAYSYHKSFLDFMTNTTRFASQELATLLCPTLERQLCLATSCFRVMHFLRFNICDLPSSYLNDSEVDDHLIHIDENISHAMRYACRHWAKHMSKAPSEEQVMEKIQVTYWKWMECQWLFWIEVMNLLKVVQECYPLLVTARQWLEKNIILGLEQKNNLKAAENFVTSFASTAMAASTPHLYVSALATYNWESPLISRWQDRFPKIPTIAAILNEDLPMVTSEVPPTFECLNWLFLADGLPVVGLESEGNLCLWDISTGQFQIIMEEHERIDGSSMRHSLSASQNRKHIAGQNSSTVWIWEVPKWKEPHQLEGYIQIKSVLFSPDGTHIMIVDQGGVHIWDISTWNKLPRLDIGITDIHSMERLTVCFSPDGKCIASGVDGFIKIWGVSNRNELHRLHVEHKDFFSLEFSPNGTQILSGSRIEKPVGWPWYLDEFPERTVQIWESWDISNENKLYQLAEKGINSAYFSPDGTFIASLSRESVQIWDASNGNKLHRLGSSYSLPKACFSPDDTHFLMLSDNTIHIFDPSSGKKLYQLVDRIDIQSVSFSSDGTHILSNGDYYLTLWNVPTKKAKQMHLLAGSRTKVLGAHFSPDGKQIVTFSEDRTLSILDATTVTETRQLRMGQSIVDACFTGDGMHIICTDQDTQQSDVLLTRELLEANNDNVHPYELFDCERLGSLEPVWDSPFHFIKREGQMNDISRSPFTCHGSIDVHTFSFSSDGSQLVTVSEDTTVISIWDTSTGNELNRLEGHSAYVNSVCFSQNGKQVVSASNDTTVRIWDVPGGVRLDTCPSYHSHAATWTFLDSDATRRDWCVDSDGWVKSLNGEKYFWLSRKMHAYLNRPDSAAVSAKGSVEVDFSTGRYGQRWAECYNPSAP